MLLSINNVNFFYKYVFYSKITSSFFLSIILIIFYAIKKLFYNKQYKISNYSLENKKPIFKSFFNKSLNN